jgi:hypothetical protein
MSTAAVTQIIQEPKPQLEIVTRREPRLEPEVDHAFQRLTNDRPLFLVAVAGITAAIGALSFVVSVVMWLTFRHYGVLVP